MIAKQYTSEAEMKAGYKANRMRLFKPQKPVSEVKALPRIIHPWDMGKPLWKREQIRFNDHILRYEYYLANRGSEHKQFIVKRCHELGLSYGDFIGRSQSDGLVGKRQTIWYELRQKFNLSYPKIGRLCGGFDHSSIISGVRRASASIGLDVIKTVSGKSKLTNDHELNKRMRAEYANGLSQAKLSEKYGLPECSIQKVAYQENWPKPIRDYKKDYDIAGIYDAYYGGWPIAKIEETFNITARTLRNVREKLRWKNRERW